MAVAAFDPTSAVGFCQDCRGQMPRHCRHERNQISAKCTPSAKENERFVEGRGNFNNRKSRRRKAPKPVANRNSTWKDHHCGPALIQVNASNVADRMNKMREMTDEYFDAIDGLAFDLGIEIAAGAVQRWGLASAGKYAASGLCGPGVVICATASTALNLITGIFSFFSSASEIRRTAREINDTVESLSRIRDNAEAILEAAQDPAKLEGVQKSVSDAMEAAVNADPCLKARKCFLVPYNASAQGPSRMKQNVSKGQAGLFDVGPMDLSDSRGCCPGQTGHHLILSAMLKDCSSYDADKAPVVCVEGANHSMGSHGKMHQEMEEAVRKKLADGGPFTMKDAVEAAAESHRSAYPRECMEPCLKEQLKRFYDELPCQPVPIDRFGRPIGPVAPTVPTTF